MKIINYYTLTFLISLLFCSCEEKPTLFTEDDAIYFGTADSVMAYSFAKYPLRVKDTIFVPVNVLGNAVSIDRSITVEVLKANAGDENAAIEGHHFEIIGEQAKVAAHTVNGQLPIVVYRTQDLDEGNVVNFAIRLKRDNDFPAEGIGRNQKLTISLAYLQEPASWGEFTGAITGFFAGYSTNFGTWSPTKYKLILDALYDPETETTITEFPGSRFGPPVLYNHYVAIVRNYIKVNYPGNYGGAGAVLNDPDFENKPIQVGPANY